MHRQLFATTLAAAAITHAQTTIEVTESSTQTNPIEVSSRPTDDVPNASDATALTTTINTSTIPTVISLPLPTIPISSVSNHINGNNTYSGPAGSSCVTVTMQGEPMFTIQTDTVLETPCTYTVYAGASGAGNISSEVLTTTSTSAGETTVLSGTRSTTAAPDSSSSGTATQSSEPASQTDSANRVGMGAEALGLAAFIGALGFL